MMLLTEDQAMLAEAAREVLSRESPLSRLRQLRDKGHVIDRALWDTLVELGWPAMVFPESAGGLGWGLSEACLVAEPMGAHLSLVPLHSVMTGGLLDPEAGAATGAVVALAWQESRDFEPDFVQCMVRDGRLAGHKRHVRDARSADSFVVSARDEQGHIGLFRVSAAQVALQPRHRMDHRDAADVVFDGAPATRLDGGLPELTEALHRGVVCLSAEMLGLSRQALSMTLDWSKERVQFDRPIGSFQALQHRMVDAYMAVERLHSAVRAASADPSPAHVALCKVTANETAMAVTREAVQIHGGIGVTDEHDIGFFLKRAMVASQELGTSRYWRDHWGRIHGY